MSGRGTSGRGTRAARSGDTRARMLKKRRFVATKNAKDYKEAAENNEKQYKTSGQDLVENTATEMFGVSIDDLRQREQTKLMEKVLKRSPNIPVGNLDKAVVETVDTYVIKPTINGYIDYANELLSDGVSEEEVKKRLYNRMKINYYFRNKEWED